MLIKIAVEAYGCGGAAQAMPAFGLVAAVVTKSHLSPRMMNVRP